MVVYDGWINPFMAIDIFSFEIDAINKTVPDVKEIRLIWKETNYELEIERKNNDVMKFTGHRIRDVLKAYWEEFERDLK